MKRLTCFDGGKWRLKIGDEETGLEPEEIIELKARMEGLEK